MRSPPKKFFKNLKKTIDKLLKKCYNNNVNKTNKF